MLRHLLTVPLVAFILSGSGLLADEKQVEGELTKLNGKCIHLQFKEENPIYAVQFSEENYQDGNIAKAVVQLKKLPKLTYVLLPPKHVKPADLGTVAELTALTELHVDSNDIADADLLKLKPLQKVTFMKLNGDKLTEAGVRALMKEIPVLRVVVLNLETIKR